MLLHGFRPCFSTQLQHSTRDQRGGGETDGFVDGRPDGHGDSAAKHRELMGIHWYRFDGALCGFMNVFLFQVYIVGGGNNRCVLVFNMDFIEGLMVATPAS